MELLPPLTFRWPADYFIESREDRIVTGKTRTITHDNVVVELLEALQKARGRLAVVVAAERKRMPPRSWSYYRETDEKMRRWLRELRSGRHSPAASFRAALEALRRLPATGGHLHPPDATHLCRRLRDALDVLEGVTGAHCDAEKNRLE